MDENRWYDVFLENLYERYPKKSQLTQELMRILFLEREAVYRRLRKDIIFTVHEIVKIAFSWNISLDEIIGINSGKLIFHLRPVHYINPSKQEIKILQRRVEVLEHILHAENSDYIEVCNRLPLTLSLGFLSLYRFKIFTWAHQYNDEEKFKLYSKVVIPENILKEFDRYHKILQHVSNTHFVLDEMIFEHFVNDVKYFHSILLVNNEEKERIKKELFALLVFLNKMANEGCYPETQKKVYLYISQLNIDTNYSIFFTDQLKTGRVHVFGKFDLASYDSTLVSNFKTWMNFTKRSSMQISEVNEKGRIEFFSKQRKIIENL